ncbi:MAG: RidA family protein [Planctomycetes bacterium]|nr:RidA family protein [Planctomycetota bacterium]
MNNAQVILPEGWKRPKGYANAIIMPRGRLLFVAGQVGWDSNERIVSDDFAAQFRQALLNVRACVEAAGSSVEHIGRVTLYVTDKTEYMQNLAAVGEVWREVMGRHYPAMALLEVKGLLETGAKIEVEADAVVPE